MQERHKVWRACQACRKKKIKCDGAQPCASCRRARAQCDYATPGDDVRLHDPEYVKSLESRLQSMQTMMSQGEPAVRQAASGENTQEVPSIDDTRIELEAVEAVETHLQDRAPSHSVRTASSPSLEPIEVAAISDEICGVLIDYFFHEIYPIFPIIPKFEFTRQLMQWKAGTPDDAFDTLHHMLLAVSASILPEDSTLSQRFRVGGHMRKPSELADTLYKHASKSLLDMNDRGDKAAVADLISHGLRSLYLVEIGDATTAWITAGHAIRLYQGLEASHFLATELDSGDTRRAHGNLWWCLYILDRCLSTALGKPLAFDDDDCERGVSELRDNTFPSSRDDAADTWFPVVADFHVTIGRIYTSIRSMRKNKVESGGSQVMKASLRQRIQDYDAELQSYYTKQVLPKLQASNQPVALQTIAVSSYYIGLVLLYRTSIETFTASEPDAFLRCAQAAAECIKSSPDVIARVPTSLFLVQQCRAIYASTKVLLLCMRMARNPTFTSKALNSVQKGVKILQDTNLKWPEIKNYHRSAQADMKATQFELQTQSAFSKAFDGFDTRRPFETPEITAVEDNQRNSPLACYDFGHDAVYNANSAITTGSRQDVGTDVWSQDQSRPESNAKRRRVDEHCISSFSSTDTAPQETPYMVSPAELGPLTSDFLLDFSSLAPRTPIQQTQFHDDSVFLSSIDSMLAPSEQWNS